MSKYFVKFVPFNANTMASLINKTVKFSTVYEFNDFNELHYIGDGFDVNQKLYNSIIENKITECNFVFELLRSLKVRSFSEEYLLNLENAILNYPIDKKFIDLDHIAKILEHIAFSSVGVFCVSGINIFDNDSAQLMFAHYAENLKGLALIYEIDSSELKKINYAKPEDPQKPPSGGMRIRVHQWLDGNYEDIKDFLHKSNKWEYENEFRMFAKPDIHSIEKNNIKLKAIFYTPRFTKENLVTLENINTHIYKDNTIKIVEIIPSIGSYYFSISNNKKITDWIKDNLVN